MADDREMKKSGPKLEPNRPKDVNPGMGNERPGPAGSFHGGKGEANLAQRAEGGNVGRPPPKDEDEA